MVPGAQVWARTVVHRVEPARENVPLGQGAQAAPEEAPGYAENVLAAQGVGEELAVSQ